MLKARKVHVKKRRESAPFVTKTVNELSWKPQTSWLISLKRVDGFRDIRGFKGSYAEAVTQRNDYLRNSLYASAWLIEEREKSVMKKAVAS